MIYTMIYIICRGVRLMDSAKLFYNGRSQAVRLPKEFRFEGEEVYIKKIGSAVVLMPKRRFGKYMRPVWTTSAKII